MILYMKPADQRKIQLLNLIAKDTPIPISFRVNSVNKKASHFDDCNIRDINYFSTHKVILMGS